MAGALDLALAGPRSYGGIEIADAVMGNGRRGATVAEIHAALSLYFRADASVVAAVAALTLVATLIGSGSGRDRCGLQHARPDGRAYPRSMHRMR